MIPQAVIPAQAGIFSNILQFLKKQSVIHIKQDSRLRGNDGQGFGCAEAALSDGLCRFVGCVAQAAHAVWVFGETRIL